MTNNTALRRYELEVEGSTAYITYEQKDSRRLLIHTVVPDALAGKGVASALARSVLEDARRIGLKVVPECEFIAAFIKRHSEFQDLVADSDPNALS
ncbi:MAG: GNAT family N-acetyltransferase [Beijerinckiaceae bacterium]|nr:GNAT family N-acetyltransferase [Beijerinckiaceae bacterium]